MTVWRDDLGEPVELPGPARRVVSLVPSLTQAVARSAPGLLVGATDWAHRPVAVGGDPGARHQESRPDQGHHLGTRSGHRQPGGEPEAGRGPFPDAGLAVWATVIESVPEALASLRRPPTGPLGLQVPDWLAAAEQAWRPLVPEPGAWRRVVVPVWRDPWMVVGARTFTGDVLVRLGLDNVFGAGPGGYPRVEAAAIRAAAPDVVLLPDEPYPFTAADGPEEFPAQRVVLVSGLLCDLYGALTRHRPRRAAQHDRRAVSTHWPLVPVPGTR